MKQDSEMKQWTNEKEITNSLRPLRLLLPPFHQMESDEQELYEVHNAFK